MIGIWAPILFYRIRFIQKQNAAGNPEPFKRMVNGSKAFLITLPILAMLTYVLKMLHLIK